MRRERANRARMHGEGWELMDSLDLRLDSMVLPHQSTMISHRQIMAVRLLQMPSQELSAAVARERDTNPALDAEERESCHFCGAGLDAPGRPCAVCGMSPTSERTREEHFDEANPYASASAADDDPFDPMLRIAAGDERGSGLLHLLCASLDASAAAAAEYLIGSLDHHGFLPETILDDLREALGCDAQTAARALDTLQRLDPPGIGARGAQECLLIQLRRLREAGLPHPLAERLVERHLSALAFRHFREVGRLVGESASAVEGEWQFIRDHLHPYPAHGFDPDAGELAAAAVTVRPDVVIHRRGGRFEAEVVERQRYEVRVNRDYFWARKHLAEIGGDDSARRHIRGFVEQAQTFIAALRQRWDTMQRVSDALIEMQRDYLIRGQSALKPLTRADVARQVGLHESTVSRATDGKYVLLPNGHAVSFDDFFDASLPVKKALRDLIAAENPRRPFSDEQLARMLAQRGLTIARRTIAKYRDEVGILPSRLRRSKVARGAQRGNAAPAAADAATTGQFPPALAQVHERVPAMVLH